MPENREQLIQQSKSRAINNTIDYNLDKLPGCFSDVEASKIIQDNSELLNNSIPVLRDYIPQNKNIIPVLTNEDGAVLYCGLNNENAKLALEIHLKNGVCLHEKYVGTNAFSLAITEKAYQKIEQNEHYIKGLSQWITLACPVFNYNNRLIGVVGVFVFDQNIQPHSEGLIKLVANSIADKFWNNLFQKKLNNERQYAFNIMNNLSYGLFATDLNDTIHWVNDTACRSVNIRRMELLNKDIKDFIPEWTEIKQILLQGKRLTDEEYNFSLNNTTERFLLNAYSVKDDITDTVFGHVITMRPFSRVVKIIGRYSGSNPYFTFNEILGKGPAIKNAIRISKTAAKSPSTILITGESGTGKEVFAQAIHNFSDRKNFNFVAINCGAISASLIESELFGYEEGAFTGAVKKGRPGKFELADKGTIFLDEIGEMPLEMQVKLLRAIQEKSITRVGGSKLIPFDVRIIAATNKDLELEMQHGNFRSDLYYRLSVIPVKLPSLRERVEDLPVLIQYFLRSKASMLSKPIPEVDEQTMQKLLSYTWPGNVRELENTIEKFVLFGSLKTSEAISTQPGRPIENSNNTPEPQTLKSLEEIEKESIENTLQAFDWNISKTASTLGIGRNTLYDKIKKHKISK